MVVIVIMGILAAVAVPKLFAMRCASDMEKCRDKDFDLYQRACVSHPDRCLSQRDLKLAVQTYCNENSNYCHKASKTFVIKMGHDSKSFTFDEEKKEAPTEVKKDTVYVEKRDTVYLVQPQDETSTISSKIESGSGYSREDSSLSREECVKKCKRENTSDGLVSFCIRDQCKEL
jgi:hypothetical protein